MTRINLLKALQLAASIGVLVLFWLIYPGVTVLFASAVGVCYGVASVGAMWNIRLAIFVAFAFSALTAVLSAAGVYRFLKNDFDFLAGNFGSRAEEFYLPPYLFLLVAAASAVVVVLHFMTWPWMIRPRLASKNAED